jgi:flagellar basal-body rod protein FlgF
VIAYKNHKTSGEKKMDNSVYVALSKQVATERQLDMLAHNLANASTVGYKSGSMMFSEYLLKDANGKTSYAMDYGTGRNTSQGALQSTGNPLDLAIHGKGYFAVQTPQGERYTRAGNFTISATGELSTLDGFPVLDDSGQPITFEPSDEKITVFANGKLEVDGDERATIGIYEFANERSLKYVSGNLYASEDNATVVEEPKVTQGMLEQSNVQPILEITKLINTQRSFISSSKFISDMYEMQENALRTLGKDG